MSVLPWPHLIATAPNFGLMPTAFWALSVREWRALVGEGQGLDSARLAELSAAFPDVPPPTPSGPPPPVGEELTAPPLGELSRSD